MNKKELQELMADKKKEVQSELTSIALRKNKDGEYERGLRNAYGEVESLIDKLEKTEKVTIPKYVAEYIEKLKEEGISLFTALDLLDLLEDKEIVKWLFGNKIDINEQHVYFIARAWVEGCEVEEELYRVILGNGFNKAFVFLDEFGEIEAVDSLKLVPRLIEKQIKAIDERYWAFAEEVVNN